MLPYPNHSSFLFDPPSSCFDNDLEIDNSTPPPPPLTSVDSYDLPFFSFGTPLPPLDPAPATKDRSDGGGGGGKRRRGQRNDRHSKISTAQGLRDRRMRLSIGVANRFFALQDMLGFDKASATVDWLLKQSKSAIEQAALGADVVPSAVLIDIPAGCSSPPKSTDSSNSLQTSDRHVLYEKAKESQPSSFRLAAFKTVPRRELRAKARARARCRTMEKKKMLQVAEDGRIGQFDSTDQHRLRYDSMEYSSCSSLSQGRSRLADNNNMIPLCMLGYHQSKDYPLIWDDADIDASYELLPRGMDQ